MMRFLQMLAFAALLSGTSHADTQLNDSEGLGGTGLRPGGEEEGIGGTGRSLERPELPERPELMQRPDFDVGEASYDSGTDSASGDSGVDTGSEAPDQPDTDSGN